jgi:translation initiation factor 2 subunit 2
MNRQPDHVVSFVLAEVGSTGSVDAAGRLIMKGRFQPKHIESLLRKYISRWIWTGDDISR